MATGAVFDSILPADETFRVDELMKTQWTFIFILCNAIFSVCADQTIFDKKLLQRRPEVPLFPR
jgi:hypothetical protein